jgi:hypothetical protein
MKRSIGFASGPSGTLGLTTGFNDHQSPRFAEFSFAPAWWKGINAKIRAVQKRAWYGILLVTEYR